MRASILRQPGVPVADRESVISAHLVLARFLLGDDSLAVLVVAAVGRHVAGEREPGAVRRELRQSGAGAERRRPLRFAAADDIQHIYLIDLVALALGRERDAPAVGAPGQAGFRCASLRQSSRWRLAIGRDQPDVASLLIGGV